MCDPVTAATIAIPLITSAGSTFLQNKAANAVTSKRNSVMEQSERDLKGFRDKATEGFQKSLKSASPDELKASNETAVGDRQKLYTDHIEQGDLLPGQASGSTAAQNAIVKALESGAERSRSLAGKRAIVDAYSDALQDRDVKMGRSAQEIAQQGSFASGRAGVTAMELEAANSAGGKYANMAGIVKALGTAAGAGVGAYGAHTGVTAGYDPMSGITWNTPRAAEKFGPWR